MLKEVLPNQYNYKTGDGAGTRYVYDAMDEVVQWTDPLGNVYATPRDLVTIRQRRDSKRIL